VAHSLLLLGMGCGTHATTLAWLCMANGKFDRQSCKR
jgi:hypothetical protein